MRLSGFRRVWSAMTSTGLRRRGLAVLVVVAVGSAGALAWGVISGGSDGSGGPGRGSSGATSTPGAGADTTEGGGGAGAGPVVEGGTARLGLAGPVVVDPAYASTASPSDLMVLDLLYDGLTRLDRDVDGSFVGGPQPALATGWTSSEDLATWRFELDPATRFSTGRAVVAADVVASLEHVIAGGDASPAALRLESVRGFRDYLDGAVPSVSGLRAAGDHVVEIALDRPSAQLPVLLAAPVYGIVDVPVLLPLEGVARPSAWPAIGLTGDWHLEPAEGDVVRLGRSDGSPAHLDAVELHPFADDEAAFEAFEDGEVDWAPVPAERYGEAVREHGAAAFSPFQAELLLGLRVDHPVLANTTFRKAIAAALDREAIVRAVYPDAAEPLADVVPAGVPGAPRRGSADPSSLAPAGPAEARRLLREAFPSGRVPSVSLDFDTSAAPASLMAIVADSLEEVGIPTTKRPLSLDAYQRLLVAGDQQLFLLPWLGVGATPEAYLDPLFRSASPDNLIGLVDPGVDGELDLARASVDPAQASSHWGNVEERVLVDAIVVPIAQLRTQVVVSPRLAGVRHAVDGTVDWSAVHRTRE